MLVSVGPVPSESALAYVRFCREQLAELSADPGDLAATLTPEVRAAFEDLLDTWAEIASAGPVFEWTTEDPLESVEYHFVAFVRVVLGQDAAGRTSEQVGADAELRRPFRVALVNGILSALEREGPSSAALAAELRAQWPDQDIV